jgi:predicted ATP-grasp superfamily ATP-dependent carboligase
MTRVLLAGLSTRAAAESAANAGFDVTAIDGFADRDQHPAVRALSLSRDFGLTMSAADAAHASRTIECDAVAYLSNFENHPSAVAELASGRALWGNPPEVLRRVRDPLVLADTLRRRGIAVPKTYVVSGFSRTLDPSRRWLIKPLASGGGRGIREWHDGSPLPRHCYLQELIEGTPGSVVFVAAEGLKTSATGRGCTVTLGVTRQLIGDPAFGATGYGYAGSILVAPNDAASDLARVVAEEFDLVGVNGVDFITRAGILCPIEVNPRWCASMELVERACGLSVFGAHAAACTNGAWPDLSLAQASGGQAVGKAIVFARQDLVIGDTDAWLEDDSVRDVPHPGDRIAAGRPVCTVLASGEDESACYDALVRRATRLYEAVAAWGALI